MLDTWYVQRSESRVIDFIWADLNGSEKDFLLGAMTALSVTRFLYIECAKKELYDGQMHVDNIVNILKRNGFEAVTFENWGENFGNVLFKNINL